LNVNTDVLPVLPVHAAHFQRRNRFGLDFHRRDKQPDREESFFRVARETVTRAR
jgi:hypothetical protein